ncbi:hypothetical protein PV10_02888 [Exophiala mesophila]|uniref:GST N-terminal domain-containing protein n=1 Tax=Exophiala mesophila TaxID=212818 RepID=A0A0D1ZMJ9_EXOME|nr:uncharacterized protein PV10_02888 [Exophiala mesophila]KIV95209.1 hypothetical protein PV10_02888 [Exophiala mesophila]
MSDRKIGLIDASGEFKRQATTFRDFVSKDPNSRFPAEKGRYHLYVSYACPWAHRALIVRKLKGLEDIVSMTCVHWHMGEKGWRFVTSAENLPGENVTPNPLHPTFTHIRELYLSINSDYQGRFSVPLLWDKATQTIVNNESAEIMRILNSEFDELLPEASKSRNLNLLPKDQLDLIEACNQWIYEDINNGVYKAGFASTQEAYTRSVTKLFESLDRAEKDLAGSAGPYYFGEMITETDIKLYTTLIRFDPVYVQHFKCNIRDIRSGYPNIHKWMRNLYWNIPAFRETTEFEHIKDHYTKSHKQINPSAITSLGPLPNILNPGQEVAAVRGT